MKSVLGDVTTYYIGTHYEKKVRGGQQNERKYYFAGGSRMAMRVQSNQEGLESSVYYLLSDHLGSTSITVDGSGNPAAELRYAAWGEARYVSGETPTQRRYTGQREAEIGLYDYGARFYDPALSRFLSPDSIVPEPGNPMDWDRHSYVRNNPVKYIDPTGHAQACAEGDWGGGCGAGSTAEQIYKSFDKAHGGIYDGLFAEYYAKLFQARMVYSQGDHLSAEAMFADAAATKEHALAFVPQKDFDPLMAISPHDIYNLSNIIVGVGKDIASSAAIFPWVFRDLQHERKAYGARGWSPADIDQTLQHPALTRENIDKRTNQKVTYYYRSDGHYVVQNNVTGEIIQTSDTTNPNWIDPLTNLPVGPIMP